MKLEDIPKEELQREAAVVAAVAEGLKKQPEGRKDCHDRLSVRREDHGDPQRIRRTPNHDCKVQ